MASALPQAVCCIGLCVITWTIASRRHRKQSRKLQEQLVREQEKRQADRSGRVAAERALRDLRLQVQTRKTTLPEHGHAKIQTFALKPIGFAESCFTQRNGTPRQPQLVPAARCRIVLTKGLPQLALEGLQLYSHCWIIYVFHHNTDLAKTLQPDSWHVKASVRVPRLNGGRMGVLATRSPHRPNPIGLSTAQVISISHGEVILGGADIVNGSPILDIKPYVPFCDALATATAPDWVQADASQEPLQVSQLLMTDEAAAMICSCWSSKRPVSQLYKTAEDFLQLVRQVLSRDIRSVHQRMHNPGQPHSSAVGGEDRSKQQAGSQHEAPSVTYHVVLDGIDVAYTVSNEGVVRVESAMLHNASDATLDIEETDTS